MRAIIFYFRHGRRPGGVISANRVRVHVRRAAQPPQWRLLAETLSGKRRVREKYRPRLRERISFFR